MDISTDHPTSISEIIYHISKILKYNKKEDSNITLTLEWV